MKKSFFSRKAMLLLAAVVAVQAMASIPSGYYNNAMGKSDKALMTALHQIINGHKKLSYANVLTAFKSTDCNGTTIIDRYSNSTFTYNSDKCGSYSTVGDCYNREHSVPNSWWGGTQDTMYTDVFHLYPTDGYVNGIRSNYPFGDCDGGTTYGTAKLGTCTFSGYSGTVFEPADEYKGDFARTYFYMATRYMTRISSWTSANGSKVFAGNAYPGLTTWAINQLLEWHRNDPVSTLETTRNDAVYALQGNRNPFIDHPELAEYIWGNKTGNSWSGSSSDDDDDDDPVLTSPTNGSTINVGTIASTSSSVSKTVTVSGSNLTKALTVSVSGTGFSVSTSSITAAKANSGTTITITYSGTATSATGKLTISSSEVSATCTLTAGKSSSDTGDDDDDKGETTQTIETWEIDDVSSYGSYNTTSIEGAAFSWTTSNVGIWSGDTNCNGNYSCRFGKNSNSSIEMAEDVSTGASAISFYAATYNKDAEATVQVQYSTDGGSTWTTLTTATITSTWQQFSYTLDVTGNVRFKFAQASGKRLNIDDIAITSNSGSSTKTTPTLTAPEDGSTVNVGTISSTGTSVSKKITVSGTDLTKALTVKVSGTGFSVTPSTITAAAANAGTTITVTYTSNTAGDATGILTISSSEVSATVNLTASKLPAPTIEITAIDAVEAEQDGESSIATATVTAENNSNAITVTVEGNFEISLDKRTWSSTLTMDASGEVFYVRLADTGTAGDYEGSITATTGEVSAFADVTGTVTAKASVLKGDVNMDGVVSLDDMSTLIDYLLGSNPSPCDTVAADINEDGVISLEDLTALTDMLLNSTSTLASQMLKWDAFPAVGSMTVENPAGELLEVYNMDAEVVATVTAAGSSVVELPAGIYVVSTDLSSRKVVVK